MSLHPDCLAELKLQHAPFDSLPNEDFIYSDALIEDVLIRGSQAINGSGAILLITGESGSGRSVQLMRLLGSLPENFELIAFRARMNTRFEAVDYTIRSHLRAGGHDDPDRALSDLIGERIRAGYDPVIAVDDAHLLGMDIINILLRMRSDILTTEGRAPRLVLVGDQVLLRRRLQLRPTEEHQVSRFTLRPFSLEQTAAYLTHRLRAAGIADPGEILTEEVIADLQAASKGLPGALNEQANHWLERVCRASWGEAEEPEAEEGPGKDDRTPAYARGMPALGVTGDPPDEPPEELRPFARREPREAAVEPESLRALEDDGDPDPRRREREPEPEAAPLPFWSRSWFVPAVAALVAFLIIAPFARHLFERPDAPPTTTVQLPLPAMPEPEPGPEPVWSEGSDLVEVPFDDRMPAEMPSPAAPATAEPETPAIPEPTPEPPLPEPAPEPPPPEPAPAEPEPSPAPPPAMEPARPVTPPPAAESTSPATPATGLSADRDWLTRQNRDHLTIQLVAAADLAGAQRYVEQHQLSGIRYIQTRSNGRDLVVALAGSFANRASAEQALGNLPAAVRADQPWIRSLGSVQDIQR
jgi:DamX protein